MPKPEWLVQHEMQPVFHAKLCIDCEHVGDPCGLTADGKSVMCRCALHPTVKLHAKTKACTDYTRKHR